MEYKVTKLVQSFDCYHIKSDTNKMCIQTKEELNPKMSKVEILITDRDNRDKFMVDSITSLVFEDALLTLRDDRGNQIKIVTDDCEELDFFINNRFFSLKVT